MQDMAPAPSSSSSSTTTITTTSAITPVAAATAAAGAEEEVADQSPSVATTTTTESVVVVALALPPAVEEDLKKDSAEVSSKETMVEAAAAGSGPTGKSDAAGSNSAGAEKESGSESFVRTLSGSRLNAKAPEFVPKGIVAATGPGSVSGLISRTSLPIPGVIPVQFVATSQSDSIPAIGATSPPVVAGSGASPPFVSEWDESFLARESSPSQIHASAAPSHAPHPKPVISDELKVKIVKQVEFYFSDQNLPTDNYLMKFVKKDPDGFVPIHIVAAFRKVKNLAKSSGVVAACLRNSTALVVSDDGKKVRRALPLPEVDLEEVQSRTVVAENLPEDPSIESVEQLFSTVGTVKMVRICQPEAANGSSQTAAKFKADMIVSNKLHALVEFETIEQAEKAVVALTDQGNWRSGLRVRLLLRRTFQSKHGFQQGSFQKGRKAGGEESGEDDETATEDKTGEDMGQHFDRSDEASGNDAAGAVDREGIGGKRGKGRGRGRGSTGRGKGQHGGSHHIGSNGSRNHQSGTSPQTSHNLMASEVVGRPPPGPRMPDGTRGFTLGRGKVPILGSA